MSDAAATKVAERAPFWDRVPRGMITVTVAVVGLCSSLSAIIAPSSVTKGPLLGMLPFASVLAIVAPGADPRRPAGRHRPLGPRSGLPHRRHRDPPGGR